MLKKQISLAESINIQFTGVIEPRASFSGYTPGKIESSLSSKTGKSTNVFTNTTPAKINVQNSNPVAITVSYPKLDSSYNATLKVNSGKVNGSNMTLPVGENTVEVDMSLKQNQVFAPGTYSYDVTLTMVSP
ncbi:MAG: hypothetical protein AAFR37_20215 [Cyanobacteria bacterium J06628_3]